MWIFRWNFSLTYYLWLIMTRCWTCTCSAQDDTKMVWGNFLQNMPESMKKIYKPFVVSNSVALWCCKSAEGKRRQVTFNGCWVFSKKARGQYNREILQVAKEANNMKMSKMCEFFGKIFVFSPHCTVNLFSQVAFWKHCCSFAFVPQCI